MEPLHTLREVAVLLRVHYHTVRRMIRDGELEAMQIGRKYFVRESTLKKLIGEAK